MPQLTIDQAMQIALAHLHSGRLGEAEQIYRQILAQDPKHAEALHYLGLVAQRAGRLDVALGLISRSVMLRPDLARYHLNLGGVLSDQGKIDEAMAAYAGSLQLDPNFAAAHFNMANALKQQGKLQEAAAAYARSAQCKPDFIEAHLNLGIVFTQLGMMNEAGRAFQQALRLRPNYADAYTGITVVLMNLGMEPEALAACKTAISLRDNCADDFNNLGILLTNQDKLEEALAVYSRAVQLKADYLEAWNNLGNTLTELQRLDEAVAAYSRARQINSAVADPHFNQAWVELLRGDLEKGWRGHEYRWGSKNFSTPRPDFGKPQWDGSELAGQRILLHAEQGLGDAIQFVRYVPMVARRGGRVVLKCPPDLARLFRSVGSVETIVGEEHAAEFDVQCPLMSLPLAFNTRLDSIPAEVPYLKAEQGLIEAWKGKLRPSSAGFKVGLAWQGRMTIPQQRKRAIPFSQLAGLGKIPGVTFYSLQKGDAAAQAADRAAEMDFADFSSDLHDFADTAALISQLDLVISIDSAVAHLAGALAKPVWTLLPWKPDWRWMLNRGDTPWYPTMRLFRQSKPGNWDDVIARVSEALGKLAGH